MIFVLEIILKYLLLSFHGLIIKALKGQSHEIFRVFLQVQSIKTKRGAVNGLLNFQWLL
jgi:hypothetical protein